MTVARRAMRSGEDACNTCTCTGITVSIVQGKGWHSAAVPSSEPPAAFMYPCASLYVFDCFAVSISHDSVVYHVQTHHRKSWRCAIDG